MAYTAKTFRDIYESIQDELQDTTADTLTLIKKLINRLYRQYILNKIVQKKRDYCLISTGVSIVANKAEYSFKTDWSITNMKKFVMIKDDDDNRIYRGDLRRNKGGYYLIGKEKIGFIDTPSSSTTYTFYYIQQPADLFNDADIPKTPLGYPDIFISGVCWLYWRLKKKFSIAATYQAEFVDQLTDMLNEISGEADDEIEEIERIDD